MIRFKMLIFLVFLYMSLPVSEKLDILSDAAKYDVSCASGGSTRKNTNKGLGNGHKSGICHTYTEDGRCVSLLKILLTNVCIYDCAYCVTRKSNDIRRAAFTVQEVVDLTINFYRRNYIEGLFLSSGIFKNADYTMERLVRVAKKLRTEHNFNGYIHLKSIPGASDELMHEAALYADRLSINIEVPTESGLKLLAPEKSRKDMTGPMDYLKNGIIKFNDEKKLFKHTPVFAPAGQSTQMIIGAVQENDRDILYTAHHFYTTYKLRRVYYSGYVPISNDTRLPGIGSDVPMLRENRLYQADWLMRFYGFHVAELVNPQYERLEMDIDPKLSWALRNLHLFPLDINTADYRMILRVPGIGVQSAQKIVAARKFHSLASEHLQKLGVALNRARYFLTSHTERFQKEYSPTAIKQFILSAGQSKYLKMHNHQLNLFNV